MFNKIKTEKDLDKLKRYLVKRGYFKTFPPNAQVLVLYKKMVKAGKEERLPAVELLLRKIKTKSNSGIVSVSLLTKPYPCPGDCLYCPTEKIMPKSYLSKEPAAARALRNKFDPYRQVTSRLNALKANGHPTDKVEIIIIGGTWSVYPQKYQENFIAEIFKACNDYKAPACTKVSADRQSAKHKAQTLKSLQKINEKAETRIVGISVETRPDFVDANEIKRWRWFGVTKVEIGVQHLDERILAANNRNITLNQIIAATEILRRNGFKIMYHMMLNLYASTARKDLAMFKKLFSDERFRPDMLKIYPCVILESAGLYKLWRSGKFTPYTDGQLRNILIKIKKIIPSYVRIVRVIRDIPAEYIAAGSKVSNMRQMLFLDQQRYGWRCRCIRCREIREAEAPKKDIGMLKRKYAVSSGHEFFLSFEDKKRKKLLAFLRLFLPEDFKERETLRVLKDCAVVRELHTYGRLVPIALEGKQSQHTGLGRALLKEAEKMAKNLNYKKIAVISGVGVRNYYRKCGYRLGGSYMIKSLV